jgi:hypothetical protein
MDVALHGRFVRAVAGPTRAAGAAMLGKQVNLHCETANEGLVRACRKTHGRIDRLAD